MCKKKKKDQQHNYQDFQDEEAKYTMRLKELLHLKRRGDWDKVSEELGISRENAMMAFRRIHSKYHYEVVAALESVIEERQKKITDRE
ncbi:hypothetical protein [Proteiniphilum sp. UBA5384]|uniref:hypothetical protein n=1 Tax=Proteiniphilum sp. UBA5384 TaxID=1947279 RepID=UPI0025D91350|nr:hypothetical protein [Proteiniphilum sp. UBA5384]